MSEGSSTEPSVRIAAADTDNGLVLAKRAVSALADLPGAPTRVLEELRNERDADEQARQVARAAGLEAPPLHVLRFLGRFHIGDAPAVILEVEGLRPEWEPQEPFFWSTPSALETVQRQVAESVLQQQLSPPPGRAPWEAVGWRDRAMQWISDRVAEAGMRGAREVVGKKTGSPWGFVVQVRTLTGDELYFKAVREVEEVILCEYLCREFTKCSPGILAVERGQGWILMHSAGTVLREFGDIADRGDSDLFTRTLQQFASFQINTVPHLDKLASYGVHDQRYDCVPDLLHAVSEAATDALVAVGFDEINPDWQGQLQRRMSSLEERLSVLDEVSIPSTIVSPDFQPTNVAVPASAGNFVFFDWGGAMLGVPFLSAFTFLRHPSVQALGMDEKLLTAYLLPYQAYAPMTELRHLFSVMPELHALNEMWSSATALPHAEQGAPMHRCLVREVNRFLEQKDVEAGG